MPVACGIPQSSTLEPLLFLSYINDMPISIKGKLLLYADDTDILVAGKDPQEIEETVPHWNVFIGVFSSRK